MTLLYALSLSVPIPVWFSADAERKELMLSNSVYEDQCNEGSDASVDFKSYLKKTAGAKRLHLKKRVFQIPQTSFTHSLWAPHEEGYI